MLQFLHSVSELGLGREGKLLKQTDQLNPRRGQIAPLKETECEVKVSAPQVPLECYVCGNLTQLTPGKVPSLFQGFLLEMGWEGARCGGGETKGVWKYHFIGCPLDFHFLCLLSLPPTGLDMLSKQQSFHSSLKYIVGVVGTWVPVSLLSKALFLFLSLSCSTRIHMKEQKSSSSSLVG